MRSPFNVMSSRGGGSYRTRYVEAFARRHMELVFRVERELVDDAHATACPERQSVDVLEL